jgi:hypothetical protein
MQLEEILVNSALQGPILRWCRRLAVRCRVLQDNHHQQVQRRFQRVLHVLQERIH